MLIPRRPNSSKLALLPLLCVLASCATPDAGRRAESATSAEALLAEARQAKDPAAQIGFALAAADSAARNFSRGRAVDLQCRLRRTGRPGRDVRRRPPTKSNGFCTCTWPLSETLIDAQFAARQDGVVMFRRNVLAIPCCCSLPVRHRADAHASCLLTYPVVKTHYSIAESVVALSTSVPTPHRNAAKSHES